MLVKRYSEYDFLPYREINLRSLGKLPNINTITKDDRSNVELEDRTENPEAFRYQIKES